MEGKEAEKTKKERKRLVIYRCDLWDMLNVKKHRFVVIPTNITVKKNGENVTGRGLASQCQSRFPGFAKAYGKVLKEDKTIDGVYIFSKWGIITFPTKENYKKDSSMYVIKRSLGVLEEIVSSWEVGRVFSPIPGIGFGGLLLEEVLPVMLDAASRSRRLIVVIAPNTLYGKPEYNQSFLPAASGKKDRRVSLSNSFDDLEI